MTRIDLDPSRRIVNPVQGDAVTFLETSEESGGVRSLGELEVAPGGKVLKNGMPRNPLHTALLLEWGDGRTAGAYAPLGHVFGMLASIARAFRVDRRLQARYRPM